MFGFGCLELEQQCNPTSSPIMNVILRIWFKPRFMVNILGAISLGMYIFGLSVHTVADQMHNALMKTFLKTEDR